MVAPLLLCQSAKKTHPPWVLLLWTTSFEWNRLFQFSVHSKHMKISILFRPKNRVRDKIFRTFRETFSNCSPSRKFFRRPKVFSKFSWQRCDSFGPKIVKIGAILTVFRPFEISRKFVPYKLLQNFLCGYKIEMATWMNEWHIWAS